MLPVVLRTEKNSLSLEFWLPCYCLLKREKVFANNDSSMTPECKELLFTLQYSNTFITFIP